MGCASSNNVQQEAPTNHVDLELAEAAEAERYHFKVGATMLACLSLPASPIMAKCFAEGPPCTALGETDTF